MREKFLVYGAPAIGEEEIAEVEAVLRSGWLGTGPRVARFESEFANYRGSPNAVAVNSCTAALHLSMLASGVGPGDEVITSAMTFCATVNAIIHSGATPVLADIDPHTLNIDPESILDAITERTRAIVVVHFAGRPCEMDQILAIAESRGLELIEDCAHAVEAEFRGKALGTFGSLGCFSFYVTKNVVTAEGGMVITSDGEKAARIKTLALHGMSRDAWRRFSDEGYRHYRVEEVGFKYNMTDIQAAIGIHQLARVEENWLRREKIWNYYRSELATTSLGLPELPAIDTRHGYHLFTVQVGTTCGISRDALMQRVTEQNIGVGVHYLSIPEHPAYQARFAWCPEDYPVAQKFGQETLSLPLSPALSDEDVDDVIHALKTCLASV